MRITPPHLSRGSVDALAVTYPLTIDDTTDDGVANVQAYTIPHMEASPAGQAVASTADEALLVAAGWTTTGTPQEVAARDLVLTTLWGTWTNNDGAGRQTDLRLRVGGLTGVAAISFRIPTTVAASAVARHFRVEIISKVVDSGGGALVLHSSGTLWLSGAAVGTADVYTNTRTQTSATIDFTDDLEWVLTADHDTASANLSMSLAHAIFQHVQARP